MAEASLTRLRVATVRRKPVSGTHPAPGRDGGLRAARVLRVLGPVLSAAGPVPAASPGAPATGERPGRVLRRAAWGAGPGGRVTVRP
ncbi:hypothetical protein [Nocardiopsis changdeensis]|uniref:hypothetical protein n=1 Tax=Nocardiopsis changdeensis TaxID=2831969 RepID=UPI003F451ED9